MKFKCNCCDGIYNSFDVHFTSACDNKCSHCIDKCYSGMNISKPDVNAIVKTIVDNQEGLDDILFLGGEPCVYLDELLNCVKQLKEALINFNDTDKINIVILLKQININLSFHSNYIK